jgi:hypothetical protein
MLRYKKNQKERSALCAFNEENVGVEALHGSFVELQLCPSVKIEILVMRQTDWDVVLR